MSPLIELENVTVVRDRRTILHRLSLAVETGGHTAILGPNGCGKSTLIRLLSREIHAHAGEGRYRVLGRERWTQSDLRTVLGVVSGEPKEPLLGSPTGIDLAVSGLFGTYGVLVQRVVSTEMLDRGHAMLKRVDAAHLASRTLDTMSAGEMRRCWIARALISEPKGLVLDEPTTGLDFVARAKFLETIRALASTTTIVLVTHHLDELIPEIQRVVLMRDGRIVGDGSRSEILTPDRVGAAFGAPAEMVPL